MCMYTYWFYGISWAKSSSRRSRESQLDATSCVTAPLKAGWCQENGRRFKWDEIKTQLLRWACGLGVPQTQEEIREPLGAHLTVADESWVGPEVMKAKPSPMCKRNPWALLATMSSANRACCVSQGILQQFKQSGCWRSASSTREGYLSPGRKPWSL